MGKRAMYTGTEVIRFMEWLDADQHIMVKPDGDERSHEELLNEWDAEQ